VVFTTAEMNKQQQIENLNTNTLSEYSESSNVKKYNLWQLYKQKWCTRNKFYAMQSVAIWPHCATVFNKLTKFWRQKLFLSLRH